MKGDCVLEVYQAAFSLAREVHFSTENYLRFSRDALSCVSLLCVFTSLQEQIFRMYENLGGKLYNFIEYVELHWKS